MGVNEVAQRSQRSGSILARRRLEHPWWNGVGGTDASFGEGGAKGEAELEQDHHLTSLVLFFFCLSLLTLLRQYTTAVPLPNRHHSGTSVFSAETHVCLY